MTDIGTGVTEGVSSADYHNLRQWELYPVISHTGLVTMWRSSPAHYLWRMTHPSTPTAAQRLGSAVHSLALTPLAYEAEYRVSSFGDLRSKAAREERDGWEAEGYQVLSQDDYREVSEISAAAVTRIGQEGLGGTRREVSLLALRSDHAAKARPDMLGPKLIVDLKTCSDASPRAFSRAVAEYGYHIQAAWYLDVARECGLPVEVFGFLCVETRSPYATAYYDLHEQAIEIGRRHYQAALGRILSCHAAGEWPGYGSDLLNLPEWALYQAEEAL